MKIVGKRIIIREFKLSDVNDLYEFGKNPNIGQNAGWKPFDSLQTAKNVLFNYLYKNETYAIINKETKEFIGQISLYSNTFRGSVPCRNLGFSIKEELWGNGYAFEAAKLMLIYAFDKLKVNIVGCGHFLYNLRSEKLINKLGFVYEGLLRQYKVLYDKRVIDAKWYSMTKDEFERIYKYERNEN